MYGKVANLKLASSFTNTSLDFQQDVALPHDDERGLYIVRLYFNICAETIYICLLGRTCIASLFQLLNVY